MSQKHESSPALHVQPTGRPRIAILGGSGLYELPDVEIRDVVDVPTPFGSPSGPVTLAFLKGKQVAFLSRHGRTHGMAPQQINYRANMWALKSLGVEAVVSSSAVGGLVASHGTDSFAVPDQFIDRTWGRADTYYDGSLPTGVQHLPAAEPYCSRLRGILIKSLEELGEGFSDHGTLAVINGPRFATRAESEILVASGAHLISMTAYPEPVLAAELNMGFANLAYVTDANTGHDGSAPVTAGIVLARLEAARSRILAVLGTVTEMIDRDYVGPQLTDSAAVRSVLEHPPAHPAAGAVAQQRVRS
ncbi:MTAP family purine nucleoside phosphorylase [Arthrobacter sp. LAPM80]|uniref:MTAP family purine nucleoside phosphorylase n=1 Tax=Arthrobacter sp. LAPM80 TaxID=3141788 RepID=UPI00398AA688